MAEEELNNTYYVTKKFTALWLEGFHDDHEEIMNKANSREMLIIEGKDLDTETKLRHQGGLESWKVNCLCGTKEDDCESMIACSLCEIRHHTRCTGGRLPEVLFVCKKCRNSFRA
ncbi:hypothetical protein NE237_030171 [Protea cynaroides]|uniref:Zinc finger PHD-type domain-containing protein n=1 Tax=Protea cynaroides TaxID=273540 RepID=A0A9Q0GTJ8_9MAGN|nr:hypothetical protein NE237_030171 [Protea cynaroides]